MPHYLANELPNCFEGQEREAAVWKKVVRSYLARISAHFVAFFENARELANRQTTVINLGSAESKPPTP